MCSLQEKGNFSTDTEPEIRICSSYQVPRLKEHTKP